MIPCDTEQAALHTHLAASYNLDGHHRNAWIHEFGEWFFYVGHVVQDVCTSIKVSVDIIQSTPASLPWCLCMASRSLLWRESVALRMVYTLFRYGCILWSLETAGRVGGRVAGRVAGRMPRITTLCLFQERLAESHGSQCGFCTPGIIMSMYTLLRNNPKPSQLQLESAFEGCCIFHTESVYADCFTVFVSKTWLWHYR